MDAKLVYAPDWFINIFLSYVIFKMSRSQGKEIKEGRKLYSILTHLSLLHSFTYLCKW